MLKKNELKNLIYIQENEQCNEQTIKGLFRSIVEPILENPVECLVMLRLEEKSKKDFDSILKRLAFCSAKVYDFSDDMISEKFENVLKEKIWEKTEFIYVLSQRYGAVLIFDYEDAQSNNFASFYTMYNSKNLEEAFDIINSNSNADLSEYEAKWHPDRRENEHLNSSIRKLVANLNDKNQEILISEMEKEQISKQDGASKKLELMSAKASYAAHEMKNLLSICNLYSDIISKYSEKIKYETPEVEKSVKNAHSCICKSLQMGVSTLMDFRAMNNPEIKNYSLQEIIKNSVNLAKVYSSENVQIEIEKGNDVKILADENKFSAVLINLIKNAIESIEKEGLIKISTEDCGENVKIKISNNGKPIPENIQKLIFNDGFTTKKEGNGLGLKICQKSMEEQYGKLQLLKSDEKSTVFELTVLKG